MNDNTETGKQEASKAGVRQLLTNAVRKGGWRVFAAIGLVFGIILLLLPTGNPSSDTGKATGSQAEIQGPSPVPAVDVNALEKRLSSLLSLIDGAGQVQVLLTLKSDGYTELASDRKWEEKTNSGSADKSQSSDTVILSQGNSDYPVIVRQGYPEYQGALVIAEGADDPNVKLELTRAVASLLGLGTDHIAVTKMKK